ncbi:hypothetical protein ACFPIJ_56510 [Dactylosporangium cerinum]|uniref:Uncharacterized protein n=1 Tax=Dactylosporangium cerinum TaxID=1434730 RepID=A0ABV9WGG5_9ACTN
MTINDHRTDHAADARLSALRGAVTSLLIRLETDVDQDGWDQPPALFGIFHHPHPHPASADYAVELDGSLVGPGTWHRPDPAVPAGSDANLHPVDILLSLPDELDGPAMRSWLDGWLHRDGRQLLGFGFCFEAWQGRIRPGYRHGDLAQAPAWQRTEVRAVAALDRHGHTWQLIRPRGANRASLTTSDNPGQRIAASRILAGLHRLNHLGRRR